MTLEGPCELFHFTVVLLDKLLLLIELWGIVYRWAVECEVLLGVAAEAMEVEGGVGVIDLNLVFITHVRLHILFVLRE